VRDTTVELRRRDEAATSDESPPPPAVVVAERPVAGAVELLEVRRVRNVFVGTKRVTWVPTARCGSRGCGVRTRDAGPPASGASGLADGRGPTRKVVNVQISTPDLMVRTGAKVQTETRTGDAGATRTPHIRRDISVLWRRILGEYAMWRLCSAKDSACALWSITQSDRH
jgi:hypothetical protein